MSFPETPLKRTLAVKRFTFKEKLNPYTKSGFGSDGINKHTGTKYDLAGVDIGGYNKDGFNHCGLDRDGKNVDGDQVKFKYPESNKDDWYYQNTSKLLIAIKNYF